MGEPREQTGQENIKNRGRENMITERTRELRGQEDREDERTERMGEQ